MWKYMKNNTKTDFGNRTIDIFLYVCIMYSMTATRANNILLALAAQNGGALARVCFSPKK